MSKKKISILGCGWLGFPLAQFFVANGYQVKGSTTSTEKLPKLKSAGITAFLIDLKKLDSEQSVLFFNDIDVLIINIPPGRPIIKGAYASYMKNILPFIEARTKVIFISSTSVYPSTNSWVDESTPLITHGNGKEIVAAENCLKEALKNRVSILRFSGLIGYDRRPGRFLANKKELKNGSSPVNLIHRDDCIALIYKIIEQGAWGEVFNGAADEHPLRKDFYTEAALKLKLTPPIFVENTNDAFKLISNKKSQSLLNFTYKYKSPYEAL